MRSSSDNLAYPGKEEAAPAHHTLRNVHRAQRTPNSQLYDRRRAVVVEASPRLREQHTQWTTTVLRQLVGTDTQVRISGLLMLDQEHPEQIGKTRGTLWEIHPITKIEVFKNGQWIDLDDLP